eukprot:275144-Rhodomonas_salina.1
MGPGGLAPAWIPGPLSEARPGLISPQPEATSTTSTQASLNTTPGDRDSDSQAECYRHRDGAAASH